MAGPRAERRMRDDARRPRSGQDEAGAQQAGAEGAVVFEIDRQVVCSHRTAVPARCAIAGDHHDRAGSAHSTSRTTPRSRTTSATADTSANNCRTAWQLGELAEEDREFVQAVVATKRLQQPLLGQPKNSIRCPIRYPIRCPIRELGEHTDAGGVTLAEHHQVELGMTDSDPGDVGNPAGASEEGVTPIALAPRVLSRIEPALSRSASMPS